MDECEFNNYVRHLAEALIDQIPDEFRRGLEWQLGGGEYALALESLAGLVDHEIPVTEAQSQLIARLRQHRFHATLPRLVGQLLPRIPPEFREGFVEEVEVGEYRLAAENLARCVRDHALTLSSAEAQTLRCCLEYLGEDTSLLDSK